MCEESTKKPSTKVKTVIFMCSERVEEY